MTFKILQNHVRHSFLAFLSSLPISVLRILDIEANKFYDRSNQLYDAALLTRDDIQHAHKSSILKLITNVILSKFLSLIKGWILLFFIVSSGTIWLYHPFYLLLLN